MSVTLIAFLIAVVQNQYVESFNLIDMISDYAKVAKTTEKPTAENVGFSATVLPLDNNTVEYDDFDELEEDDRSINQRPPSDVMKYFNGIISLLTLLYRFNGSFDVPRPPKKPNYKTYTEPRQVRDTGRRYQEAQDRFEFPQKKFKYQSHSDANKIDQQYQPVENYPPYNPLKANAAETYNKDDKKTSYDADLLQYDGKHTDVDIQQSYSYEIPYETAKPVKQSDWNTHHVHPVYQPWMSTKDNNNDNSYQSWSGNDDSSNQGDSYSYAASLMTKPDSYQSWNNPIADSPKPDLYQSWASKPLVEDHHPWKPTPEEPKPINQPWKSKPIADEPKPTNENSDARQPYPNGDHFPVYHHPGPDDHHFEFHEVDHPMADEDRMTKKPYSYYFLGRKLWYIPLLFSVYFIIYIGALVLKSVARHKIQFPEKIWNLHDEHFGHAKSRRHRKLDEVTEKYEKAVEKLSNKFM